MTVDRLPVVIWEAASRPGLKCCWDKLGWDQHQGGNGSHVWGGEDGGPGLKERKGNTECPGRGGGARRKVCRGAGGHGSAGGPAEPGGPRPGSSARDTQGPLKPVCLERGAYRWEWAGLSGKCWCAVGKQRTPFTVGPRRGGEQGAKELEGETAEEGLSSCSSWEKLSASGFTSEAISCQLGRQHRTWEELEEWERRPEFSTPHLRRRLPAWGISVCVPQEKWGALL